MAKRKTATAPPLRLERVEDKWLLSRIEGLGFKSIVLSCVNDLRVPLFLSLAYLHHVELRDLGLLL